MFHGRASEKPFRHLLGKDSEGVSVDEELGVFGVPREELLLRRKDGKQCPPAQRLHHWDSS